MVKPHRSPTQLIRSLQDGEVEISCKDRDDDKERTVTLKVEEFIRRYLMHSLPSGFRRIRQYGFLANRSRKKKLTHARELLNAPTPVKSDPSPGFGGEGGHVDEPPVDDDGLGICSTCGKRSLVREIVRRKPPPVWIFERIDPS